MRKPLVCSDSGSWPRKTRGTWCRRFRRRWQDRRDGIGVAEGQRVHSGVKECRMRACAGGSFLVPYRGMTKWSLWERAYCLRTSTSRAKSSFPCLRRNSAARWRSFGSFGSRSSEYWRGKTNWFNLNRGYDHRARYATASESGRYERSKRSACFIHARSESPHNSFPRPPTRCSSLLVRLTCCSIGQRW